MLDWLSKFIGRRHDVPPPRAISQIRVSHDDRIISVRDEKGRVALLKWTEVERVHVTVDKTDPEREFQWVLSDRDGRSHLSVPMGAEGEGAFIKAMQARLAGFDNMAVVEALSSPTSGEFQVWPPADLI